MAEHSYQTILHPSQEIIFKEKKSKFLGYAFPVDSQEAIKRILSDLKSKHQQANHICYAWQLEDEFRCNDDGEPNNTAGVPIHGQIKAFNLNYVLVAVVRYFGGVKLGSGGLIQAYKETAKQCLETTTTITKARMLSYQVAYEYALMNVVMTILKNVMQQ